MPRLILSVSDVVVCHGKKIVVSNAKLEVHRGECVALIGTSGAGKSSLLKTIACVQARRSGRIVFDEVDASGWSTSTAVQSGLILCPEGRQLFPRMTVFENVALGAFQRRLGKGEIKEEVERLGDLFHVLRERPQQEAGTLSGGEQQMVAIARALMGAPKLLLLDEPSLGLSPILTDRLFETIRTIRERGCTVLIAEQNVYSTLKVASRAYVVESGVVSSPYKSEDVITDPRLLSRLLGE